MLRSDDSRSLYDTDFNLWIEQQVEALRSFGDPAIDSSNIVEELESLAKRDKRELESRLIILLVHLIKIETRPNDDAARGWHLTVREQMRQIQGILRDSPSLKNYLRGVTFRAYRNAQDDAALALDLLPNEKCHDNHERYREQIWLMFDLA